MNNREELFKWNGNPSFKQAFPLALQHVVAMIVGCGERQRLLFWMNCSRKR